ncbi:hypothetical protein ACFQT0_05940 [Hymenobacter humi]|uniref:Dipeptidylpeptidase IV N-terminal domain-containing protein n=1 Tax=Hymenobacter humi TaxID=1411620 RepID=A0ABW2U3M1_9BACT
MLATAGPALAQAPAATTSSLAPLTVEKIMRDPAQWLGTSPSNVYWGEDGRRIYFNWNPTKDRRDSLYQVAPTGTAAPRKVSQREQRTLPASGGVYDARYTRKVYERDGDIYLLDLKTQRVRRVTNTAEREASSTFAMLDKLVSYVRAQNLYTWDPATGETTQRTDFRKGSKPASTLPTDKAERYLRAQQAALFDVVRLRDQDRQARESQQKALAKLRPKAIYLGQQTVENLQPEPRWPLRNLHAGAGASSRQGGAGAQLRDDLGLHRGYFDPHQSRRSPDGLRAWASMTLPVTPLLSWGTKN